MCLENAHRDRTHNAQQVVALTNLSEIVDSLSVILALQDMVRVSLYQ